MSVRLQVIGVVEDKVRVLVLGEGGPWPCDLSRIEALRISGLLETAAQALPSTPESEPNPTFMRVEPPTSSDHAQSEQA